MKQIIIGMVVGAAMLVGGEPQPTENQVRLEIKAADFKPGQGLVEMPMRGTKRRVYVEQDALLTNADVASAALTKDAIPEIEIVFTEQGRAKLAKATADTVGKPLAILINGKVISAPRVMEPLKGGKVKLSGNFPKDEAKQILEGLTAK